MREAMLSGYLLVRACRPFAVDNISVAICFNTSIKGSFVYSVICKPRACELRDPISFTVFGLAP
jgi:hypothetical protein